MIQILFLIAPILFPGYLLVRGYYFSGVALGVIALLFSLSLVNAFGVSGLGAVAILAVALPFGAIAGPISLLWGAFFDIGVHFVQRQKRKVNWVMVIGVYTLGIVVGLYYVFSIFNFHNFI